MPDSQTLIQLALSGGFLALLGGVIGHLFTRRRTAAEASAKQAEGFHSLSDAFKSDAEAVTMWSAEIRQALGEVKVSTNAWAECMKEKSITERRLAEESAEREKSDKYAESLRLQKVALDDEVTKLRGEISRGKKHK